MALCMSLKKGFPANCILLAFDAVAGRYHRYRLAHRQSMPESDYHSFTSS